MIITPAHVNAWRARTQWILRGVAFLLIVFGSYLCLKRITFGAITGDISMLTDAWQGTGETHSLSRGTAMLFIGVGMAVFTRRLSRWIITLPTNTCPRCGYIRTRGGGTKCTECGRTILDRHIAFLLSPDPLQNAAVPQHRREIAWV